MTNSEFEFKLCLTSINENGKAQEIAQILLQQKLVACVNISSQVCSMYLWQGSIVKDHEFLILMKTSSQKISELRDTLAQIHPYDVHEFIVLNIENGSKDYLNWLGFTLSKNPS